MTQVDYTLPHYAGGCAMVHWSSFGLRVSARFFKSTMNRDLAQTFPQLHADLAATMSPQLLHSGLTAHEISRKAIMLTTARFAPPPSRPFLHFLPFFLSFLAFFFSFIFFFSLVFHLSFSFPLDSSCHRIVADSRAIRHQLTGQIPSRRTALP